jgi:hypothetical protein
MRPVGWSWAGLFRPEITEFFSARPEPGLARKMLRSSVTHRDGIVRGRVSRLFEIDLGRFSKFCN